MSGEPNIAVAAHREDHPPLPYAFYDRSDPMNPDWALRHEEFGQAVDTALATTDPDDPGEAVAEAAAFLARRRGRAVTADAEYPAFAAYLIERAAARLLDDDALAVAEAELRARVAGGDSDGTVIAALAAARAELRDRGVEPPGVA